MVDSIIPIRKEDYPIFFGEHRKGYGLHVDTEGVLKWLFSRDFLKRDVIITYDGLSEDGDIYSTSFNILCPAKEEVIVITLMPFHPDDGDEYYNTLKTTDALSPSWTEAHEKLSELGYIRVAVLTGTILSKKTTLPEKYGEHTEPNEPQMKRIERSIERFITSYRKMVL